MTLRSNSGLKAHQHDKIRKPVTPSISRGLRARVSSNSIPSVWGNDEMPRHARHDKFFSYSVTLSLSKCLFTEWVSRRCC